MRLVFVHGINHQNKSSEWVKNEWLKALSSALPQKFFDRIRSLPIDAPFYGDALYQQAQAINSTLTKLRPQSAGNATDDEASFYKDALFEIVAKNQDLLRSSANGQTVAAIPQDAIYNNRYLIDLLKALQDILPDKGSALLRFLPQAFVYLKRIAATQAVDNIVRPALAKGPCIVVAHSLGTIVSFKLLRELKVECPLFLTMGSPLAIKAVQSEVSRPFGLQPKVESWKNMWDPDDLVTLNSPLTATTFGNNIDNYSVENGYKDAHDFRMYLRHREIWDALDRVIP